MKKKAALSLESPLIAVLIGSLFFIGLFSMFTDVGEVQSTQPNISLVPYTTQQDTQFEDAFNNIQETKEQTDAIIEEFQDTVLNPRTGTDLFAFFNVFYQVGKQIFGSLNIVKDIINIVVEMFGLPAEIVSTFFTILAISILLLILYLLLGRST